MVCVSKVNGVDGIQPDRSIGFPTSQFLSAFPRRPASFDQSILLLLIFFSSSIFL